MAPYPSRRLVSALVYTVVSWLAISLPVLAENDPPAVAAPGVSSSSQSSSLSSDGRDVSPSLLPGNFLHDQGEIFLFPRQLARGRYWSPTIVVASATVALLSADPHVDPYFNHTTAFRRFNRAFGSELTGAETIAIPSALYVIGYHRQDSYMQNTALFAGEAVADSEVVRVFINSVTTRWRPQDIYRRRNYADTFFHSVSHVGSSFPSGHTIAAVAVATVIARRYREHRWVPWVAYGLAGTIGFSRISLRAHFPSDVFLGGILGYAIARYDVLQDR
jgi:membrane-associated phospholipid phosphatase